MNTIAPAIKRRRTQLGITQKEMSDKMHLSEKAYQNIENGNTKLDIARLQQIAEILEMPLIDLINSQESFYIHQVTNENNQVGFSAKEVIINNDVSESERKLFDKMLADKDAQILTLRNDLTTANDRIMQLTDKLAGML